MKERYESYKDSGVPWIGQVPKGWEVVRVKHYLKITNGCDPTTEGDVPVYGSGSTSFKTCGEYKKGPTVLLGRKGTINIPQYVEGKYWNVDTAFDVKSKGGFDLKLFYYMATCFDYESYMTQTAVPSMAQSDYNNIKIPLPPLPIQRAIASYLDARCAAIDAYVASLEREAGLARELKQALIARAVTRGLDPNTPMRDSGIPWIGQMPQGWEVRRLPYIFRTIGSGTTPDTSDATYYENGSYNWLQTGDLNDGEIVVTQKKINEKALKEYSTLKVYPKGSLVVAMYGATIGKVGLTRIETATNQACCVLAPSEKVVSEYAFYALIASKQSLINKAAGGGQPNISQGIIRQHKIPYPPLPVQRAITGYLDARCAAIDAYVASLEREAALARELKQREIADAVTGKVKITG